MDACPADGVYQLCVRCGAAFDQELQAKQRGLHSYCSLGCSIRSNRGRPRRLDDESRPTYITSNGYIAVWVGKKYSTSGYQLEHRVVMAAVIGRSLTRDEHVHHIDGNKQNNDPTNLETLTNAAHQRVHNFQITRSTRVRLICQRCGNPYEKKRGRVAGSRFCSNTCRLDSMHIKAKEYHAKRRRPLLTCQQCGDTFHAKGARAIAGRFCSKTCHNASMEKPVPEQPCEQCGQMFRPRYLSEVGKRRFCSNDCRRIVGRQKLSSAKAPMAHTFHPSWATLERIEYGPNWLSQRRAARARDEYRCQHCGIHEDDLPEQLTVAHKVAFRTFARGQYDVANTLENLISLCRPCHTAFDHEQGLRPSMATAV